ncbi:hypothetical protein ACOME3_002994 [Neoechinorhynchus agilis]
MDVDRKYELITRNLQEVLGGDRLKEIISSRPLRLYWGTATTGKPHVAYFVPIMKIADFLMAGCEVKILLADLHGYLDNMKAPWKLLYLRTRYYEYIIKAMLKSIDVPIEKLKFIMGTEYQLSREYTLDVYRMSSLISQHDAKKAGAEVVKQVQNPLLSGLLYPCLQALDEQYLDVDGQFGGVDQRKIFTLAEKYLPSLGYAKRIHLMNPMMPGLTGTKMSASEEETKIDLLDSPRVVERKIKKAFCEPGNIKDNGILIFVKYVILPIFKKQDGSGFRVKRTKEFGGDVVYESYNELESAYETQQLHPGDLKKAVTEYINRLLKPIRETFENSELSELKVKAYEVEDSTAATNNVHNGNMEANRKNADVNPTVLDLRVGRILSAKKHPSANSLYVEEIDVGENSPRTIVSGLAPYTSLESLTNHPSNLCVVLCNCKPMKMRDVVSSGILLTAIDPKCKKGEVLRPPSTSIPGDPVWFIGHETQRNVDFIAELNPKKKLWETLQTKLTTGADLIVRWNDFEMVTHKGTVNVHSLSNAPVK